MEDKYVGPEKYVQVFRTIKKPCTTCSSPIDFEERVVHCAITFLEVKQEDESLSFNGSLHGHKILDLVVKQPCRWEFCS